MNLRSVRKPQRKQQSKKSSSKVTTMADLLAQSGYNISALRRGQEVKGKVISLERSEILIDIGAKSEGIIFGRELDAVRDLASKLSVGDSVEATVLYPENEAGQVVLSLRKQYGERRWAELEEKRESGEPIQVVASEINRGGVICEYFGLQGFLPALQIFQPSIIKGNLIGKTLRVQIIDLDKDSNRLIFSRKQQKEELKDQEKLLKIANIGEKYEGEIKAVLPFGILVEISIDVKKVSKEPNVSGSDKVDKSKAFDTSDVSKLIGLVHISEISWEKIEDLTRLFKVGEKVEVMLVDKDEVTGRMNLSIKQLAKDPFGKISEKYSKDQVVSGNVSKITRHGVFVSLEDGIEGFIVSSKIPPDQSWEIGQSVECTVESVDTQKRKISLVPVIREKPILYR